MAPRHACGWLRRRVRAHGLGGRGAVSRDGDRLLDGAQRAVQVDVGGGRRPAAKDAHLPHVQRGLHPAQHGEGRRLVEARALGDNLVGVPPHLGVLHAGAPEQVLWVVLRRRVGGTGGCSQNGQHLLRHRRQGLGVESLLLGRGRRRRALAPRRVAVVIDEVAAYGVDRRRNVEAQPGQLVARDRV